MNGKAFIKSIAWFVPEKKLGNDDIQKEFGGQIQEEDFSRLGIKHRGIANENTLPSDLAFEAAQKLVSENNINLGTIEALVYCSVHTDYITPATSSLLHQKLGLPEHCATYDIRHGCSGYVYGLSMAKAFIEGLGMSNILLLTSSALSRYIHKKDKASVMVFGDGASATHISSRSEPGIGNFIFGTDGSGASTIIIKDGSDRYPLNTGSQVEKQDEYGNVYTDANFFMDGVKVFLFTLEVVPELIENTLKKNGLKVDDIDLFILHQANNFVNEQIRKKLNLAPGKFFYCVEECGNTVQASIPIALREATREKKAKKGDRILLAGFGVGLSWAATVITL
jgi:3-oxoacyl-[acyl-carrier-protein] synthase-3